ncbi:dihydroorotase [Formicincola oecophyllae]|uniref:Dihydroorotase n=1 Tax=Formicincola oecophyllae TaxID=2558361 RepID=A0A4Y6U8L8_9PROT|nr:dihydroorotase [Formicincola oecophyllae]QDH12918.1 dihydroorotase [Formicincola oecophyllae]
MAHYDLIIRNGLVYLPWGRVETSLGLRGGRIANLNVSVRDEADEVIDAHGLHVLPGLVDAHVHLREPGKEEAETIATGTEAAALGGIATVLEMPNTNPPVVDDATLAWQRQRIAETAHVDVGIYVGATHQNTPELARLEQAPGVCGVKVFAGSSTGTLMVADDAGIEAVLRSGHRRVSFHAEDEERLRERRGHFHPGQPYGCHAQWRDPECALRATKRIAALARKTGRPVHILHVSTEEETAFLAGERALVSTEVLASHLTLTGPECYERLGGRAVVNPPLRDQRHAEALWKAIRCGLIDVVSSDHAPHEAALKNKPWLECPSGLTGVQTLLPVMLNHVNMGRLSMQRLVDLMATGPARLYGMATKGRIALGQDADFTLVDLGRSWRIEDSWIASPAGWTPYDGMVVRGAPIATIVRGQVVMQDGALRTPNRGSVVRFLP